MKKLRRFFAIIYTIAVTLIALVVGFVIMEALDAQARRRSR